jgi:glycosyltransferase involved in cell wall biosynthesis
VDENRAETIVTGPQETTALTGAGPEKIRVLFAIIQMAMGGAERLVYNLIKNLDRTQFEPSLVWFVKEQPLPEFVDLGIPLHYLAKKPGVDVMTMRRMSRLIRDQRIDLVNAHHFMPVFYAYYGARIANRSHVIYTEHSENDVLRATGLWRTIGSRVLRGCDGAIGVSEPVSELVRRHYGLPRQNVWTIENGVDFDRFVPGVEDRARARAAAGFADDESVIGIVANFRHNKNHRFLVQAFAEAASLRPRARLVIVGQGFAGDPEGSEHEIRGAIRAANLESRVDIIGYRSDVREVLRALDVFCLVSYREGLPLSLIEAMATGVPVVGTSVAGIRDVIQHGVTGLLVTPDDVPGLSGTLIRLIDDRSLRLRLATEAQRVARERYSFRRCIEDTQRFFRSVVTEHPSPTINVHRRSVSHDD